MNNDQYQKSGPAVTPEENAQKKIDALISRLTESERLLDVATRRIDDLEKEVRRFKSKLDEHANTINRIR